MKPGSGGGVGATVGVGVSWGVGVAVGAGVAVEDVGPLFAVLSDDPLKESVTMAVILTSATTRQIEMIRTVALDCCF